MAARSRLRRLSALLLASALLLSVYGDSSPYPLFRFALSVFLRFRLVFATSFVTPLGVTFHNEKKPPFGSFQLLQNFYGKSIDFLELSCYNKTTTRANPKTVSLSNHFPTTATATQKLLAVVFYCNVDFTLCHAERNYVPFFQQNRKKSDKFKPHKNHLLCREVLTASEVAPVACLYYIIPLDPCQ